MPHYNLQQPTSKVSALTGVSYLTLGAVVRKRHPDFELYLADTHFKDFAAVKQHLEETKGEIHGIMLVVDTAEEVTKAIDDFMTEHIAASVLGVLFTDGKYRVYLTYEDITQTEYDLWLNTVEKSSRLVFEMLHAKVKEISDERRTSQEGI